MAGITDLAAWAFHSLWARPEGIEAAGQPQQLIGRLRALSGTGPVLTVKIPEGFEFYALFPEQYCAAAEVWAAGRPLPPPEVLVVGVRSIGTTLSAVIKAALEAAGWRVARQTVRPEGDPFHRQVHLGPVPLAKRARAIVVDEGPGMSGPSIAAVVCRLREAGFTDVSIFPGHDGQPGAAASEQVREVWAGTRSYTIPLGQMKWDGLTLEHGLARCRWPFAAGGLRQPNPSTSAVAFGANTFSTHQRSGPQSRPPLSE